MISDEEAMELVNKGEAQRFDFPQGFIVLQWFPDVLYLLLIKFNGLDFTAMQQTLVNVAQQTGRTKLQGAGRRGWLRKMKPYGWYPLADGTLQYDIGGSHGLKE